MTNERCSSPLMCKWLIADFFHFSVAAARISNICCNIGDGFTIVSREREAPLRSMALIFFAESHLKHQNELHYVDNLNDRQFDSANEDQFKVDKFRLSKSIVSLLVELCVFFESSQKRKVTALIVVLHIRTVLDFWFCLRLHQAHSSILNNSHCKLPQ